MTQSIIEKKHQWGGGGGGGGGETNVKLKLLGGLYTKRANSVHGLCNMLSLHCQEGAKIWEVWGTPAPSMKLCWCVGSLGMCTLLLVCTGMWLVENMSWVCMLMGSYSCVCWECTLMLGVKNVI